ncbi:MAG: DUF3311 domain-containing protein [Acidobacteria bacterium]|nr:DUF3311 domain-containing protein [Acidobacteriota bacterium]
MQSTESLPDIPTRGPAKPLPYVISGIALAIAIILPLVVPMYASKTPTFAGFPFFYWYQMLWVPICAVLIGISYILMTREDRRRRAVLKTAGPAGAGRHAAPETDESHDGGAEK